MPHIRRVFIANRGEIARRIAIGARSFGIEAAALYSGEAPPAFLEGLVQHFIQVPEESPALYLNAALMVQLAVQSQCDAVHPGFGFLSENAGFARLVIAQGLTWIGPSPAAIDAMASKAAAREIAQKFGVPVVPGIERLQILDDGSHLKVVRGFIRDYGFPILLKAVMGGGGKGMRVVRRDEELEEAIRRAQSEALNAFGDAALIIERYVEHPRHVEVQILGDSHGTIYALGDRDCSVQRRHQKIIEEAPAPGLTAATRQRMQEAAVRLAQSVGYESAGTVEFIVDWSPARRELQEFFFLEMNTRLQVEHPVTEQIFSEDLVVWQFRIAAGEKIEGRLQLQPQGHSIELRLYAEDCAQRFLPAPGTVFGFMPAQLPGIRWEIGIDGLDEITARFDPMIAKLVSTGASREQAIERLIAALHQTVLAIPTSNIAFLLSVLHNPGFTETQATTRFIEERQDELNAWIEAQRLKWSSLSEQALRELPPLAGEPNASQPSPLLALTRSVFQKSARIPVSSSIMLSQMQTLSVPRRHRRRSAQLGRGLILTPEGSQPFCFCQSTIPGGTLRWLSIEGQAFLREEKPDEMQSATRGSSQSQEVHAPVPGKVVKVLIEAGAIIQDRQVLLILESMKMEFEVQANRSGTIERVAVIEGQQVQADELLAHWAVNLPAT